MKDQEEVQQLLHYLYTGYTTGVVLTSSMDEQRHECSISRRQAVPAPFRQRLSGNHLSSNANTTSRTCSRIERAAISLLYR